MNLLISGIGFYLLAGLISVIVFTLYFYIEASGKQRNGEPITLHSLWNHSVSSDWRTVGGIFFEVFNDVYLKPAPAALDFAVLFICWWGGWLILGGRFLVLLYRALQRGLSPLVYHPLPTVKHKRKNVDTAREALETMTLDELTEVTDNLLDQTPELLEKLLQRRTRS